METYVWCYRSGQIEFGPKPIPKGALPIGRIGSGRKRRDIENFARRAYDNKTLLVPGIPEAEDDNAAYEAFEFFVELTKDQTPEQRRELIKRHEARL